MEDLATALADAGGVHAPRERSARLRALLGEALTAGAGELGQARSGYGTPVTVAVARAPSGGGLRAVLPVDPALRADPDAIGERAWLLTAATVGALVEAGAAGPLTAGAASGALCLHLDADADADPELAVLAFEEQVAGIDRLRARALAVPSHVLDGVEDLRAPIGAGHPLLVALEVARLGGHPADPAAVQEHEEAVLAVLQAGQAPGLTRPHDEPDPARRAARRILQRLDGMGKWGGYHTEFAHLARGFAAEDRALAAHVGEALLDAGLLAEKPSVGQRHVFLNPRRAADIHLLIEQGQLPDGLVLPRS